MPIWWLTRCHVHYGIDGWLNDTDHYSSIAGDCWVNYWLSTDLLPIGEIIFSWSQHLSKASCKTDVTLLLKITYLLHQAIKWKSMGGLNLFYLVQYGSHIAHNCNKSISWNLNFTVLVKHYFNLWLINLTADIKMIFWCNKKLQVCISTSEEPCQWHT